MRRKEETLSMEKLFIEIIDGGEEDNKYLYQSRSREGLFSGALTMWLMICQRSEGGKSLVEALSGIGDGSSDEILKLNERSKRARDKKVSLLSGGYSKARSRLKIAEVEAVTEQISEHLIKQGRGEGLWHGKRAYLMDGTCFTLEQGAKIQEQYPPLKNQHRASHNSKLLCLCIHELFSGAAVSPSFGPYRGRKAVSEVKLCIESMAKLGPNSLLIGDRYFGAFSAVYAADKLEHQVLVRLNKRIAEYLLGYKIKKQNIEEKVTWGASKVVLKDHPEIPQDASVEGRVIVRRIQNKGYRPLDLYFFTTSPEEASELVALYKRRECIENDFRSIKYTLGMEMFHSKTPEMIEKELLLGFAAYNLLRAVIAKGAKKLGIPPRKLSFTNAGLLVRTYGNKLRDSKTKEETKDIMERFMTGLSQVKLPNRKKNRVEPRKVVKKPNLFPLMKLSRDEERALAEEALFTHGHRASTTTLSTKS